MKSLLRLGMVGGGPAAFIGAVHRQAAALCGGFHLVCGAFSGFGERSLAFGRSLGLAAARCYADYAQMLRTEAALPAHERMQCLAIVSPNHTHFPIAQLALSLGFPVLCEKPLTLTRTEAAALRRLAQETGTLLMVAHTYCGYPMVEEMRHRIATGAIGRVQKVVVDYTQGWLAPRFLPQGQKQAAWRMDPATAGAGGCLGDIGVHAAQMVEHLLGEPVVRVLADLAMHAPDRVLDDDAVVLLRFASGARGVLNASQICAGEENNFSVRLYGERGYLRWEQQRPDTVWFAQDLQPVQMLRAAQGYLSATAQSRSRLPPGHPEGYLEAFANLYADFHARICGEACAVPMLDAAVGEQGMAFIEACVRSAHTHNSWVAIAGDPA